MGTFMLFWLLGAIINYIFWKFENKDNLFCGGFQPIIVIFSLLLSWIFLVMQIIMKASERK
jgi:hypothetical protein